MDISLPQLVPRRSLSKSTSLYALFLGSGKLGWRDSHGDVTAHNRIQVCPSPAERLGTR